MTQRGHATFLGKARHSGVLYLALITFITTFVAWKNGRKRNVDSLRQLDEPG
jgi:hypothetical protein